MKPLVKPVYPFTAVVGQEEMKLALILNVIDPTVGGVLLMGHRGTGKSTIVRALADLLPAISCVSSCIYNCDPRDQANFCRECQQAKLEHRKLKVEKRAVPVAELPLGATEDRVSGTIDIEHALAGGLKRFEPGLLARANRGFLYIDEVNLLEDHLVDLLLDVAVTGVNKVERESISVEHPAKFVLIGSGNPEEGDLRPQLLDRFGLFVEVRTEAELNQRVAIVERRDTFESNRDAFRVLYADQEEQLRKNIVNARKNVRNVKVDRRLIREIARLCSDLKIDGHRGELTITRAARALAAYERRKSVGDSDVTRVAAMALRHRLRRDILDEAEGGERINQALEDIFPDQAADKQKHEAKPDGRRSSPAVEKPSRGTSIQNSPRMITPNGKNGGSTGDISAPVPALDKQDAKMKVESESSTASASRRSRIPRGRQTKGSQAVVNNVRGRYARSVQIRDRASRIALDATLRAVASSALLAPAGEPTQEQFRVSSDALRFKLFKQKRGRLFIFAIDLSGSMARNRIAQAKATMLGLLRQSYVKRDRVAIVAFRGASADLLLPPSRSILRARRALDSLALGGGTPLSAGLACALQLVKRNDVQGNELTLLLFTDGHANVPIGVGKAERQHRKRLVASEVATLGASLKSAGVRIVLINTQHGYMLDNEAHALAATLGAEYQSLPGEGNQSISLPGGKRVLA